jgi:hypothetical protein
MIPKQLYWNPIVAAQIELNNFLARLLEQKSFGMRTIMSLNAPLFWETQDRNVNSPKLCLRQGPMIYIVDLTRKDDNFQVEKIRWLRPKSMGPLSPPPAAGQPPATPGTPAPETPAPETPAPAVPAVPTPPAAALPATPAPAAPAPAAPAPAKPAEKSPAPKG